MNKLVYKHYDRKALDEQYDNRARVKDFQQIVRNWQSMSEMLRKRAPMKRDLRYGAAERETLDIIPAQRSDAPVLAFFHGGYWQAMDKQVFHFIAGGLIDYQVSVALVNYPLAPQASLDEIVQSCRRAMAWLYQNIHEHNGSPDRLFASGHSAGGHIVAMLLATDWKVIDSSLPVDLIKGGCCISGLFDLEPIRLSYVNDVLKMDEPTALRNSPVLLEPVNASPLILAVGELESEEYHAQSRSLLDVWLPAGIPVTSLIVPACNHFSIVEELSDTDSVLSKAISVQLQCPAKLN